MPRLLGGSFLAAIAMFFFGALFWTATLPYGTVRGVADHELAAGALAQLFPDSGLYMLPAPDEDPERYAELHRRGPWVMANVVHDPGEPMQGATFVAGFIHQWVTCLLLGLLLLKMAPERQGVTARAGLLALAGFTAAFFIDIGAVIWWRMPLAWQLYELVHDALAWSIAGFVLARFTLAPPRRGDPAGPVASKE
jgi:hypothetical protein